MKTWDKKEKDASIRKEVWDRIDESFANMNQHQRHVIGKTVKLSRQISGQIMKNIDNRHGRQRLAIAMSVLFNIVESTLSEADNLEQEKKAILPTSGKIGHKPIGYQKPEDPKEYAKFLELHIQTRSISSWNGRMTT